MERLSRRTRVGEDTAVNATHDEVLLDDSSSRETPNTSKAASPQPVAQGISNPQMNLAENNPSASETGSAPSLPSDIQMGEYGFFQNEQQWRELVEPGNTDHLFSSLNWLWPFDGWGDQIAPHIGPPGAF